MICSKCGALLPAGARFCPACGADQTAAAPPRQPAPGYPQQQGCPQQQPNCQQQQNYAPPQGYAPQQNPPRPVVSGPAKKKNTALIVAAAILVALIVAAVAFLAILMSKRKPTAPAATTVSAETTAAAPIISEGGDGTTAAEAASTAATEPTETAVPAAETTLAQPAATAAAPQNGDENDKYKPGHYIQHTLGGFSLYAAPDADWENSRPVEATPGKLMEIDVTEVRINNNTENDYEVWRGKTTIDGETGWVDLYEWTCTDLRGRTLTEAETDMVFTKLKGAWRFQVGDQLIEFAERNGVRWVTATANDASVIDFELEMSGPMYGDPNGLVRITLLTGQGYERYLLTDLTIIAKNQIMWQFEDEGWIYSYYDDVSIEAAGPHGGGAR